MIFLPAGCWLLLCCRPALLDGPGKYELMVRRSQYQVIGTRFQSCTGFAAPMSMPERVLWLVTACTGATANCGAFVPGFCQYYAYAGGPVLVLSIWVVLSYN